MDNKQLGYFGEDAACGYLEGMGYKILARNFTIRGGELDIIAEYDNFIVFVEVKTRKSGSMVCGAEAVTKSKQELIIKTAEAYIYKTGNELQPRFDVISVEVDKEKIIDIIHIEAAFDVSR